VRVLIRDGVLVDGSGQPPVERASLIVEDHLIEAVVEDQAPAYDRADVVVEANGGFILPGVLDHHAHGMTRGPLMITGEPALSDARARRNRTRLLREGVTRVLNVDGFAVVEEGRAASIFPGLTVATTTLHTPRHLEWATDGPFVFGGIKPRHHSTLERELAMGAVAVGELGPGIDDHWIDYTILPLQLARAGGTVTDHAGRRLRLAAEAGRKDEIESLLSEAGTSLTVQELLEQLDTARAWCSMAREACEEGIAVSAGLDVPVIVHHTPPTFDMLVEAAKTLGPRLICAHSNFQVLDPEVAVEHAQELRGHGALIDVMTGDAAGARQFTPNDDVTHAMMRAGCVDLISTDYVGGFWDSMLAVVERAAASGALPLEEGVRAVTGRVAEVLPRFAPERGVLAAGLVADVTITAPGRLSQVEAVLVSGIPVNLGTDRAAP
jgi:predicted amidohydrolase